VDATSSGEKFRVTERAMNYFRQQSVSEIAKSVKQMVAQLARRTSLSRDGLRADVNSREPREARMTTEIALNERQC
jgi:hypothetical protein